MMALRQMLGVAILAFSTTLATTVALTGTANGREVSHSPSLPFPNVTLSRSSSDGGVLRASTQGALPVVQTPISSDISFSSQATFKAGNTSFGRPRPSITLIGSAGLSATKNGSNPTPVSMSFQSPTTLAQGSVSSPFTPGSVESGSSQLHFTQARSSSQSSNNSLIDSSTRNSSVTSPGSVSPMQTSIKLSSLSSARHVTPTSGGDSGRPRPIQESGRSGVYTWQGLKSNGSSDGIRITNGSPAIPTGTVIQHAGTGTISGKIFSPTKALATVGPYNTQGNTTTSTVKHPPTSNATVTGGITNSTLASSTFHPSAFNASIYNHHNDTKSTQNISMPGDGPLHNATFTNSTWSNAPYSNGSSHTVASGNSTQRNASSRYLDSYNLPSRNVTSGNFTFDNLPFASGQARLKDQTDDCSSTVTMDLFQETKTFITTTLVEDGTITIFGDAATPPPVFVTPPPPCHTNFLPFHHKPGGKHPATSTLLVTKKSPVVIRSPQTVGPIYNTPISSPQPGPVQPMLSSNQAMPPVQSSASTNGQAQPNSDGQVTSQTGDNDQSPGSAPLKQMFPEVAPSGDVGSGSSSSPPADAGVTTGHSPANGGEQSNGGDVGGNLQSSGSVGQTANGGQSTSGGQVSSTNGQSSGSGEQSTSGGHVPGINGQTSGSGGQPSTNGVQSTGGGQAPGTNGQTSNGGQTSENGGQSSSGEQTPSTGGQSPSIGETPNDNSEVSGGGQSSDRGSPASGSGQTSGNGGPASSGSQISGGGDVSPKSGEGSVGEGQTPSGGQSSGGAANPANGAYSSQGSIESQPSSGSTIAGPSTNDGDSSGSHNTVTENGDHSSPEKSAGVTAPDGTSQGSVGGTDSDAGQYVPNPVNVDNVPISVANSAVIVGSRMISAGSPPTTVTADGHIIAVGAAQITAPDTTIPIEAAITSPPVTSAVIGNVPLVLAPDNVVIGSQTFNHGSSPAFAVYDGQTYSWDAMQLVGPGGAMIDFPSATAAVPHITAGGQVFSVYSSTLKASGTDVTIPNTPEASPFTYHGQTFSINPSQLIAPERSITVPPATQPTPFVYEGQTYSIDSSRFIAPSATVPLTSGSGTVRYGTQVITVDRTRVICPTTTITLPDVPQTGLPSAITAAGLSFSLGPQAAVLDSSTYSFLPGQAPATITDQDQTITLDPSGVNFGDVIIPIPTSPPSYSAITQDGATFSVAPSAVVLEGKTLQIEPSMAPIYTVVNNQTISIGAQGIGLASTTIPLPVPSPRYATVTEGDLTFSVAPSEAVIRGSTFAIGPSMAAVVVLDGQTVSIGPSQINFPGTIVDLPTLTSQEAPVAVTAYGLTFSVGPTNAIIGGTSYAIGSGAIAETVAMGSETIKLGSNGVILPSTTIPPEQTPTAMTVDGLTFSADNTEAIINGTAYAIGSQAIAKTIVVGSDSIGLGTKGIVFPSTTIAPWGNATQTSLSSIYAAAALSSSMAAAAAVTAAAPPPTGLPGTDTDGNKDKVHHSAGLLLKPPDIFLSSVTLGGLILGVLFST